MNITEAPQYINFSKLNEYNESFPIIGENLDLNTVQDGILTVFANYTVLQWAIPIIIFVSLFLILRNLPFLNLSDTQTVAIVTFPILGFQTLLLVSDIFTIIQPVQLFFVVWLISVIVVIAKKNG